MHFGPRDEDLPLFQELGLKLAWEPEIELIGIVSYDSGQVRVEAGAAEQAYHGRTYKLPSGEWRAGSDWRSINICTVDDREADHSTLIVGIGLLTPCWAFTELVMARVPLNIVTRAAGRLAGQVKLTIEQVPRDF